MKACCHATSRDGCCKRCCCSNSCAVLAASIIMAFGLVLMLWVPGFVKEMIEKEISVISPDTIMYTGFVEQAKQVSVFYDYAFFNTTNSYEVEHHGAKPNLTYIGPFRYERSETRPESDMYWTPDGVLHYKTRWEFKFRPELSAPGLHEDMLITTPRAGIFLFLQLIFNEDTLNDEIYQWLLEKGSIDTVFTNRTVGELVHGYNESVLERFNISLPVAFAADQTDLSKMGETAILSGPKYPKSDTYKNPLVERLPERLRNIGQYIQWHGDTSLPYWLGGNDSFCNYPIRGGDGDVWPPGLGPKDKRIDIFVDNLHRSLEGVYTSDVDFFGLTLHRYTLHPQSLESSLENAENWCFCIFENGLNPYAALPKSRNCTYDNIFAVLGKPFYLDCNTSRVNVSLPRAANRVLDDSHLDVEPTSGVLMHVQNQLQLSVLFGRLDYKVPTWWHKYKDRSIPAFKNLPETWLPIFTASERYEMPEKWRHRIELEVLLPLNLAKYLGPTCVAIAGVVYAGTFIRTIVWWNEEDEEDAADTKGEEPLRT